MWDNWLLEDLYGFGGVVKACECCAFEIEVIQINSFGCGPDAITSDEIKSILNTYGKNPTLIKVDEITSTGSVKLRIRSLVESMKIKEFAGKKNTERAKVKVFRNEDVKKRTILLPRFAEFYDPLLASLIGKKYNT